MTLSQTNRFPETIKYKTTSLQSNKISNLIFSVSDLFPGQRFRWSACGRRFWVAELAGSKTDILFKRKTVIQISSLIRSQQRSTRYSQCLFTVHYYKQLAGFSVCIDRPLKIPNTIFFLFFLDLRKTMPLDQKSVYPTHRLEYGRMLSPRWLLNSKSGSCLGLNIGQNIIILLIHCRSLLLVYPSHRQ